MEKNSITPIQYGSLVIGDGRLTLIGGPCMAETRELCLEVADYLRDRLEGRDDLVLDRIFVTHTLTPEHGERLAEEIRALHYFDEVLVERAGATISSHCGPGTIGYLTIHKD